MTRISVTQRRQDFIHAAIEVIAAHGTDGATTRKIAEAAQANVAMLHYCYDSKEDLFSDVYKHIANEFREVLEGSAPHSGVADTAVQMLRGLMEGYIKSPTFAAATVELISWARRQHGDRGIQVYNQALDAAREVLRRADSEQFLDSTAIDEITYVVATLADGFALNWYTYNDPSAAKQQLEITCSVMESWLADRFA